MKKMMMTMCLAMGTLSFAGSALAEDLTAIVPFAFHAGKDSFAAGKYTITQNGSSIPALRARSNGHSVFLVGAVSSMGTTMPLPDRKSGRLVFHCYSGQKCFLAEVWSPSGRGTSISKSRAEKDAAAESAVEMATIEINVRRAD